MDMPFWTYLLLNVVIGVGMAGVGMNVMHDGNHGAYSNKSWVNKLMGGSIYILGRKCLQLASTTQCFASYLH